MILEQAPGTYALILKSESNTCVQIGRWREIKLKPGYYIYVGSAFGPGVYGHASPVTCAQTNVHTGILITFVGLLRLLKYGSAMIQNGWSINGQNYFSRPWG
jgi:hypothetical protein